MDDLPEELIQRIQYFLGPTQTLIDYQPLKTKQLKEVARTSVLSKSWYSAWSTRPNLILTHRLHSDNIALETLRRYKNLGTKPNSLELRLRYEDGDDDCVNNIKETPLADKLIVDSLNLGLNELHVTNFYPGDYIRPSYKAPPLSKYLYRLPAQVFETATLTKLCARHCCINSMGGGGRRVLCSRLVSLTLLQSSIDEDALTDILLVCGPSIQYLIILDPVSFSPCQIDLTPLRKLVHLHVRRSVICLTGSPQYCNMTTMRLEEVVFDKDFFFSQFSCLFPCLENLTLTHKGEGGYEEIRISSKSLKYLELVQGHDFKKARLEVPNIQKLALKMACIPSLSLIRSSKSSKEWESDVEWKCCHPERYCHGRCQSELRNLLTELSESKISLLIKICNNNLEFSNDFYISMMPLQVENLKVYVTKPLRMGRLNGNTFLRELFSICRPRFMAVNKYYTVLYDADFPFLLELPYDISRSLHKNEEYYNNQENKLKWCLLSFVRRHIDVLEEVNLELFDNNLKEWSTIPSGNSIDASSYQDIMHQVRFHFIWRGDREPEPSSLL